MAIYNIAPLYKPQFIPGSAGKLILAPSVAAADNTIVPVNFNFEIITARITNVSAAPVSLTLWRVPAGAANGDEQIVVPSTVNVPIATNTSPWFDVGVLWGAVLQAGDAIWGQAGAASALSFMADGAVIQV